MLFIKANKQDFLQWSDENQDKAEWMYHIDRNGEALASIRRDVLNEFLVEFRDELTDTESAPNTKYRYYEDFVRMFRDELLTKFPAVFLDMPTGSDNPGAAVPEEFKQLEATLGLMYGPRF